MSKIYKLDRGLIEIRRRIDVMKKNISRPLIVGIAGGSGSGKTTRVAKKIHKYFPGSAILHMDDYFKGKQFMESIGSCNFDDPRATDLDLLNSHLKLLKSGLAIQKPIYSFKTGMRRGCGRFKPAGIIILEGLFTLRKPIADQVDFKIFIEISLHGSLIRRLLRDVGRTGQTERDIFKQYVETVYPMHKIYVEPTKVLADIVLINRYVPEIEAEACKNQQIQLKAVLKRKIALKKLQEIGFKKIGNSFQEDIYYSTPNWKLPYGNELMRIRKENGRYFLAYKASLLKKEPLCVKPKIEFEVEFCLKNALEELGYQKLLSLKKKRQKFSGPDNLELVLDEIDGDGRFIELRTETSAGKKKIPVFFKKLGIGKKDITKKSYPEILLSKKTSA